VGVRRRGERNVDRMTNKRVGKGERQEKRRKETNKWKKESEQ
jgi:hypothetical protein